MLRKTGDEPPIAGQQHLNSIRGARDRASTMAADYVPRHPHTARSTTSGGRGFDARKHRADDPALICSPDVGGQHHVPMSVMTLSHVSVAAFRSRRLPGPTRERSPCRCTWGICPWFAGELAARSNQENTYS